jgi:hypothetical protein
MIGAARDQGPAQIPAGVRAALIREFRDAVLAGPVLAAALDS